MSRFEIRTPATIFDMADYCNARTALQWAIAKEMHAGGQSWHVARDGVTLGVFGVYPMGEGQGEAWFNAQKQAANHMLALVRLIRLTLDGLDYREIVTICTTRQGTRIARSIGFKPGGSCDIGEVWKWTC